VVNLREIRMLKGIVLEGESTTVRVSARQRDVVTPATGDAELTVDVAITANDAPARIHYRALADLKPVGAAARGDQGTMALGDIPEIVGTVPPPVRLDEAYRDWLFHGPLFQGIASIESIGPEGASSLLRTSSPRICLDGDPLGEWLIDPVTLDSALQLQLIWARLYWDVTLLPLVFRGYRRILPTFEDSKRNGGRPNIGKRDRVQIIRHEMRMTPENQAPMSHADHYFFDHKGRPLAILSGAEAAGSKSLNRLARAVRHQ
jgi:hypothetical protein